MDFPLEEPLRHFGLAVAPRMTGLGLAELDVEGFCPSEDFAVDELRAVVAVEFAEVFDSRKTVYEFCQRGDAVVSALFAIGTEEQAREAREVVHDGHSDDFDAAFEIGVALCVDMHQRTRPVNAQRIFAGFDEVGIEFAQLHVCVAKSLPEEAEAMLLQNATDLRFRASEMERKVLDIEVRLLFDVGKDGFGQFIIDLGTGLAVGQLSCLADVLPSVLADAVYLALPHGETLA